MYFSYPYNRVFKNHNYKGDFYSLIIGENHNYKGNFYSLIIGESSKIIIIKEIFIIL